MANSADIKSPLDEMEKHLASRLRRGKQDGSFDMDDTMDASVVSPFPELHSALLWLNEKIFTAWTEADRKARHSQSWHRFLARTSILTGTAAIILAIIQLALNGQESKWVHWARTFDMLAVGLSFIAVIVGLTAKFNRRWFGQRHYAERLRMLKFQALAQWELWCGDRKNWQASVESKMAALKGATGFHQVERWSRQGEVEPVISPPSDCVPAPGLANALAIYYRVKRLDLQADYFRRHHKDYKKKTDRWKYLSLLVFFASVACVLAHFFVEHSAADHDNSSNKLANWFVAAAAAIPVLGLGIRALFAAFELPRSASLFAAKYRGLVRASTQLRQDCDNLPATLRHIAHNEHFLEDEHREWLRLHLDTEWFL